jgi:hypothetical protein
MKKIILSVLKSPILHFILIGFVVYFSFASAKLPDNPEKFLQQLEGVSDISGVGEFSLMGNKFSKASFQTTAINFGKPFAQVVFKLPLNQWNGPIESFREIHYVRVTHSHDPELPPLEKMESYLRTDYLMQKSRDSQQEKIDDFKKNYEIIVEGK